MTTNTKKNENKITYMEIKENKIHTIQEKKIKEKQMQ